MSDPPSGNPLKNPAAPQVVLVDSSWSQRRILTLLALSTLVVSVIWHLPQEAEFIGHRVGEIFVTLVLATGLTYLLRPPVNMLARTRLLKGNRSWATLLVFLGCGLGMYLVFLIGLRPVTRDLVTLWHNFIPSGAEEQVALFDKWRAALAQAIAPYRNALPPEAATNAEKAIADFISSLPTRLEGGFSSTFHHVGFLVELLLLPVLVFYFLADGGGLRSEVKLLVPLQWRANGARMLAHLDRVLDGYIRGQIWMCLIAWVAVSTVLWILQVPHAFTLGFLAGLTRAIPVIGPLLGAIPIALVCLLTTRSIPTTGSVLAGFMLMHFIESKVLLPKIVGHEVDLHPVSVIVVLLLGLEFFGFMGIFLAVPVAAVVKVLLTEWHEEQLRKRMALAGTEPVSAEMVAIEPVETIEASTASSLKVDHLVENGYGRETSAGAEHGTTALR